MGPDTGATETVYDSGTSTWISVPQGQGFASGTTVYLDWESSDVSLTVDTDYIVAWCRTVAAAGYQPGVYCHPSEVTTIAAQLSPYQISAQFWVAAWTNPSVSSSTTQFPTYDPTQAQASATSWQYGDVYSIQTVNGLLSPVDLDTSSLYGSPAAPTLIGPGSSTAPGPAATSPTTFQWDQVTDATSYLLQVKDVTAGTGITTYPISGGSTTYYTLGLNGGDAYWWNMYAYVGSNVSTVSTTYYFTTVAAPTLIEPGSSSSPGPTATSPTAFQWNQ